MERRHVRGRNLPVIHRLRRSRRHLSVDLIRLAEVSETTTETAAEKSALPDSEALQILRRVFGYDAFRGEQAEIIDTVVAGGDALVLMPTGGGKSLCYQIPALVRSGVGVVISPLIALMQDQVDALTALGVRAGFLNSTQDFDQRREVEQAFLSGELDLLYLAPVGLMVGLIGVDKAKRRFKLPRADRRARRSSAA